MPKKTIRLSSREDLKIYMSPLRQQLLRVMRLHGLPITAKALSDRLAVSPSSAAYHIRQLEKLGIVALSHTENIHGITARYYRLSNVNVNIGMQESDDLADERSIVIQNILFQTLEGIFSQARRAKASGFSAGEMMQAGDFLSGVVHLSSDAANELLAQIRSFIETHEMPAGENTVPWEYALILYNADGTR